ncbi:MAG: RDD family protein [Alphaproteobacteria bacterium]|nr:RDD family protein [Alphaproteobacteria bacterium]MDP6832438.1 RDD family protein [Alphaproteobacteria bacterium]MDP6872948.1 RDD family protein [Alphaproteobacteria bacterium]
MGALSISKLEDSRDAETRAWLNEAPDPLDAPELYDGIRTKRLVAYGIDLAIILCLWLALWVFGSVFALITLGLLFPVLSLAAFLLPFAYHTLLIGGASNATLGMRVMDLRVVAWNGHRPGYAQAALQTVLFIASAALTNFLILGVSFFNPRGRCLHDFLAGTVIVNDLHLRRLRSPA